MIQNQYIPGVCNIGEAEIARRSKKLKSSLFLLSLVVILFFYFPLNLLLFTVIASLAEYAAILFFQLRQKFCIVYGWKNVFNFNGIKERKIKVVHEDWKRMDKIQVLKILFYSALSTSVFLITLAT